MTKVTEEMICELCTLSTRDESGRHFIEVSEHWEALESAGLIVIDRPMHPTGVPYSQEHWSLDVTPDGQEAVDAYVDAHPEQFS